MDDVGEIVLKCSNCDRPDKNFIKNTTRAFHESSHTMKNLIKPIVLVHILQWI